MILDKIKKNYMNIVCLFILCVYLISIFIINFSGNPNYYVTDMYSDMNYAAEVWKQGNIFPEGWVFGNQLYVVATPVLAALFYGLCNNYCIAMGIASTLMGIGVLLSFNYMLKPIFQTVRERLIGIIAFMSLVLAAGHPIYDLNGWQLFFTMCTYYACYAISVFLAFGFYLRSETKWSYTDAIILLLSCALSFGTGMQSLRQTLIMVCPLIAVEILYLLRRIIHKEKIINKSLAVVGLISFSNLAGVISSRIIPVNQVEIFGELSITNVSDILSNVRSSLSHALSLFVETNIIVILGLLLIFILAFCYTVYKLTITKNSKAIACILLLSISVAAILFIDIFTSMAIRNIYYFLLFPLTAIIIASLHSHTGKVLQYLIVILLIVCFIFNYSERISPIIQEPRTNNDYEEVVDYLEENNITTIFTGWDRGEKIGIASNWRINVGFWNSLNTPFVSVKYLCNPKVFDADPSCVAYVFWGKEESDIAIEKTNDMNIDFTLIKHFVENDIYVFTSNSRIMQ